MSSSLTSLVLLTWIKRKVKKILTNNVLFLKKLITSTYSNRSNSLGFNIILKKFCEMICEIILSKKACSVFLIFCSASFVKIFIVKRTFFGTAKSLKVKHLETYWLKKISARLFENLTSTNNLEGFFSRTWNFKSAKPLSRGSYFCTKKWFYTFLKAVTI